MRKLRLLVFALVLCALAAAGPLPDNPGNFGYGMSFQYISQTTGVDAYSHNAPSSTTGGGVGGKFSGKINGNLVDLWCIDSQLFVPVAGTYSANVYKINDIPVNASNVQYNGATFTNNGAATGTTGDYSGFGTLQSRYLAAAYLISKYDPTPEGVSDTSKNRAIQGAVWTIIHNESITYDGFGDEGAELSATYGGLPPANQTVKYWVDQAATNAAGSGLGGTWAVLSWANGASSLQNDYQTFLVRVVPEPGFYGVLALGLSGLLLAVRRRKA